MSVLPAPLKIDCPAERSDLDNLHSSQDPGQFNSPAVDSRFDRAKWNPENFYYLLIAHLFNVTHHDAFTQIGGQTTDGGMHLTRPFTPLNSTVWRINSTSQVKLMLLQIVTNVGWCAGSASVVIDDQVSSQSHEPVGEITGLRIVLIKRAVDPNKDLLSKILGLFVTSTETIGKIVDTPGEGPDDLFPRPTVTSPAPPDKLAIGFDQ